jgi:ribosomal protein S18 acetylase RimI-like enzyme
MNYIFRKMHSDDTDSIWSLFQGIKAEKIDMSFAKITKKEEIQSFVDNPSELTYVAISEDEPHKVLCLVKGRREMTDEKRHAAFLSAATHPHVRGGGLVVKLTDFALKDMKNEGVTIARIYVYSNNNASINAMCLAS